MLIPPVMPKAGTIKRRGGKNADYYKISVKQFAQHVRPGGLPATTVWGYGPVSGAGCKRPLLLHNAPSLVDQPPNGRQRPVLLHLVWEQVGLDLEPEARLLPTDHGQPLGGLVPFPFIADERRAGSTLLRWLMGLVDVRTDREV